MPGASDGERWATRAGWAAATATASDFHLFLDDAGFDVLDAARGERDGTSPSCDVLTLP